MQIFPAFALAKESDFFLPVPSVKEAKKIASDFANVSSKNKQNSDKADFLTAIHEALEAVDNEQEVSASAALASEAQAGRPTPLVQGPYSRNTSNGVIYTLDEVCLTKTELVELRGKLLTAGAPEEALKKFDALVNQPDGATIAQVTASLQNISKIEALSNEDKGNLLTLLGKIDPTGNLSDQVITNIYEGKGKEALTLIHNVFAALEKPEGIEISRNEAVSLGRALGLDQNALQTISDSFGGFDALRSTSAGLETLMAPASTHFANMATQQLRVNTALDKTLQETVTKARTRMEKEKAASALRNKKADLSKLRIDSNVGKKSRDTLDETLAAGQHGENTTADTSNESSNNVSVQQNAPRHSSVVNKKSDGEHSTAIGKAGTNNAQDNVQHKTTDQIHAARPVIRKPEGQWPVAPAANTANTVNAAVGTITTNNFVRDLNNKVSDASAHDVARHETNQHAYKDIAEAPTIRKNEHTEPTTEATAPAAKPVAQTQTAHTAQQVTVSTQGLPVARQIAEALTQAIKNNDKRVDLQLNPQELGTVSIALAVHDGKAHARIRTENPEAAELLHSNLDALRTTLEDNGLKVGKIIIHLHKEFQAEHQNHNWQDLRQFDDNKNRHLADDRRNLHGKEDDRHDTRLNRYDNPRNSEHDRIDDNKNRHPADVQQSLRGKDDDQHDNLRISEHDRPGTRHEQDVEDVREHAEPEHNPVASARPARSAQTAASVSTTDNTSKNTGKSQQTFAQKLDSNDNQAEALFSDSKPQTRADARNDIHTETRKDEAPRAAATLNKSDAPLFTPASGVSTTLPTSTDAQVEAQPRSLSRKAAAQVEQSMLTTLKNGGTRLDLQLNPEALGAVSISLVLRNGEVSARIRPEKTETAEMLTGQLDAIRINLEQQGIKVSKLEVQLQNGSDQQNNFDTRQNLDQHNNWQENTARQEDFTRMRTLASLRNSKENDIGATLEQPVQSLEYTAKNAARSLHLVA